MSRIGKKPIQLPVGVSVSVSGDTVSVKGPQGELSRRLIDGTVAVAVEGTVVTVTSPARTVSENAMWGTVAAHIKNMVAGVVKPFEKRLLIDGIGFKWDVKGTDIVLALGFSHPVKIAIPKGVKAAIDNKGVLTVTGIDKEQVGELCAKVRSLREPEPYKGKGIRYDNEVIRRKQGKKTV